LFPHDSMHSVRIARVNIKVPDELLAHAKAAGLNISGVAASALSAELDRRAKITALEALLREFDADLGPVTDDEAREAREWADGVQGRA
jgi:post-segregation antitoxin (ccd killing protein)